MGKMKNIIYGVNVLAEPASRIFSAVPKGSTELVPIASKTFMEKYSFLGNPFGAGLNIALDTIKHLEPKFGTSRFYLWAKAGSLAYGAVKLAVSVGELYNQSSGEGIPWEPLIGAGLNSIFTGYMTKDTINANKIRRRMTGKKTLGQDLESVVNFFKGI